MKLLLFAIFVVCTFQSITSIFNPEIVVGVIKKENQAIVGVFKMDDNGKYFVKGDVDKSILKQYHCFGFEKTNCDFIKLLTVSNKGILPSQKYVLLYEINKVHIENPNKSWLAPSIQQSIQDLFTSISHAPRYQRRKFRRLLSNISEQFGSRRRRNIPIHRLLSAISQQYGGIRRRRISPVHKLLSAVSQTYGGMRSGRTLNRLLSRISPHVYGNVPSYQKRKLRRLLTNISEQFGGRRRRNIPIHQLLSSVSQQFGGMRSGRTLNRLLSRISSNVSGNVPSYQKRKLRRLLTNISEQFGGSRRRGTGRRFSHINKILSRIDQPYSQRNIPRKLRRLLTKVYGSKSWMF